MFFFFNDTATTEIYTLSLTTLFRSDRLEIGGVVVETREIAERRGQHAQRRDQAAVELAVEFGSQAAPPDALEQVEAQLELVGMVAVVNEERARRRAQPRLGIGRGRRRALDRAAERRQRLVQDVAVDVLLARKVEIDRARRIAGGAGDEAD